MATMVILKIMVFVVSPGNLLAHPVLLLNAVDRHRQGGRARASAESGDEGAACKKLFTSAVAGQTFSSSYLPMLKMNVIGLERVTAK